MKYKLLALLVSLLISNVASSEELQTLPYKTPRSQWHRQRQLSLNLIAGAIAARTQAKYIDEESVQQIVREMDDRLLYVTLQWLNVTADLKLRAFQPQQQYVKLVIEQALQVTKSVQQPTKLQRQLLDKLIKDNKYYSADPNQSQNLLKELSDDAHAIVDDSIKILSEQLI